MAQILGPKDLESVGGIGIIQPALQNRWRASLNLAPIFQIQAVAFQMNYVSKLFVVVLEQTIFGEEHSIIHKLLKLKIPSVHVECLDGNENILTGFTFNDCKIVSHNFSLDYAESKSAKHVLTFSYKSIDLAFKDIETRSDQTAHY